jgi:putative Holliday junction resolvase
MPETITTPRPRVKSGMSRIISIDYGLARIGVARSDPMKVLASPLTTIQTERKLELTLAKVAEEIGKHNIEKVVVGNPLHMNGKSGCQSDEVREFASRLETLLVDIPVVLWDERLTTVQAERAMREGGMNRKKRMKVVDSVAAVLILQSFLDAQSAGCAPVYGY